MVIVEEHVVVAVWVWVLICGGVQLLWVWVLKRTRLLYGLGSNLWRNTAAWRLVDLIVVLVEVW